MNTLVKRSLSGIVFVVAILAALVVHPYLFFVAFAAIQFFLLKELKVLAHATGISFNLYLVFFLGLCFFSLLFSASTGWINPIYIVVIFPLLLIVFISEIFSESENPLGNAAYSTLAFLYIPVPIALINLLVYPKFSGTAAYNPLIFVGILVILWMYDTGAYLFGSLLGKHKLLSRISPRKSWEGLIGGGILSLVTSVIVAVILQSPDLVTWMVTAILIVVFGTAGDLFESLLKRKSDVKDSGNILPGHGGLLDRFDSLLFIVPPVLVWFLISGKL